MLAAWLDHFDAREQNSMDSWIVAAKGAPDASPGHVVHYYLDMSDCLGSAWNWEPITRRLGYSYVADWSDIARDFVTLGIPLRPWDRVKRAGYNAKLAAENVGTGQVTIEEVIRGWQKSPGHDRNLLLAEAEHMGIALVRDPRTEFKTFWTLVIAAGM